VRQTLFTIPHEAYGLPVFGLGWVLIVWALFGLGFMAWLIRKQGWNAETRSFLGFVLAVAAVIAFGLPIIERAQVGPENQGLPIRGYGVMLLLAVGSGVGLAAWRAQRMGVDPEIIYSLAFWMFVFGILGARLFYVIEYRDQFLRSTLQETLVAVLNVTQGGLVVYGSVIGGVAAGMVYLWRRGVPILPTADLIAPSMVLGLAIGRVGCFLNGCCFGGVCDLPWAMQFPEQSPPYFRQHQLGQLHGFRIGQDASGRPQVDFVAADSPAAQAGLRASDRITAIQLSPEDALQAAATVPEFAGQEVTLQLASGEERRITVPAWEGEGSNLPSRRLGLQVMDLPNGPAIVSHLTVDGPAEQAGLTMNDRLVAVRLPPISSADVAQQVMQWAGAQVRVETERGVHSWTQDGLPQRSLPIHPTQLYSTIGAFLIFLFLWAYYPFRTRDGEVFAWMITIYPVVRIFEEIIRIDEPAQFGTGLSISQLISVAILLGAACLWTYIARRPRGSIWPESQRPAERLSRAPAAS
jgi:phosphatidylglycerol:prolipoprotein diacylglycerol transferase